MVLYGNARETSEEGCNVRIRSLSGGKGLGESGRGAPQQNRKAIVKRLRQSGWTCAKAIQDK
jgi:hypothetical protein